MNALNVWVTPDGRELLIPDDVWGATKFTKTGWPDKRLNCNKAFWVWLDEQERLGRWQKAEEPHINGDESREPEGVLPPANVPSKLASANQEAAYQAARAQAYALRVWSGQSPDVPRNERLKRVAKALEGQGLSMEGVVL